MYTVASPDPNPRGGGQLPNPKGAVIKNVTDWSGRDFVGV